jgi:hypothetical protein
MRSKLYQIVSVHNWFITPKNSPYVLNWFTTQKTSARLWKLFTLCSQLMFHEGHACVKTRTVHMHILFRISDVFSSPLDRKIKLSGGLNAVHKQGFKKWALDPNLPSTKLFLLFYDNRSGSYGISLCRGDHYLELGRGSRRTEAYTKYMCTSLTMTWT